MAGRVVSLAAAGHSIGHNMAAGEWRSIAFLRYSQADELAVPAMLNVAVEADEESEFAAMGMHHFGGQTLVVGWWLSVYDYCTMAWTVR